MNVVRLDNSTFLPIELIERYSSMIWTERFLDAGEFELTTYDIDNVLNLLPVEGEDSPSLISLSDSKEVMIIETHRITIDEEGRKKLVTKGRSLESFLEQRVSQVFSGGYKIATNKSYTEAGVAELLMWNSCVNTTTYDIPTDGTPAREVQDTIPNLAISDSSDISMTSKVRWIESKDIYSLVLEFLRRQNLGIRCIRPNTASAKIITFSNDGTPEGSGTRVATITSNITKLLWDVYNGQDRTSAVIFTQDQGYIINPQFVFTNLNLKNVGCGAYSNWFQWVYYDRGTVTTWSGLQRRVLLHDAGSPFSADTGELLDALTEKLESLVKRQRKTVYLDGDISLDAPYKYGVDYFLGDKVAVQADYNIRRNFRVLEYVRVEDTEGERAYPVLSFDGE